MGRVETTFNLNRCMTDIKQVMKLGCGFLQQIVFVTCIGFHQVHGSCDFRCIHRPNMQIMHFGHASDAT